VVRVRFAPSPTGSLHVGSALTAAANRRFADEHGGALVLRVDDTDASRIAPAAEQEILADLAWLGIAWDEGPLRQSERGDLYAAAAGRLLSSGAATRAPDGAVRFHAERRPTLVRADGTFTYHLASVVDDVELAITHVIRGRDHLPNTELHRMLARALGASPPEYVHHGLLVGPDGRKLSKRDRTSSIADLRDAGIPPEAVRAYLEELDLPHADVRLDLARLERLSTDAIAALDDADLAARAGAPARLAPALRGARTLAQAAGWARQIVDEPPASRPDERGRLTLERLRDLVEPIAGELDRETAHAVLRELKAVGGDLGSVRLALTGAGRGPELWAILHALPRDETLARLGRALEGAGGGD
jgi:glutamyl/glutaminyl-tRNA synthetase